MCVEQIGLEKKYEKHDLKDSNLTLEVNLELLRKFNVSRIFF